MRRRASSGKAGHSGPPLLTPKTLRSAVVISPYSVKTMKLVVGAASIVAGTIAGAVTFTTLSAATEATATSVYLTTSLTRIVVGKGVSIVAGPTTAAVVEAAIGLAGHTVAVPAIRSTGQSAAALSAAAAATVAAAVAGATATFLHYIASKIRTRLLLRQTPDPIPHADLFLDKELSAYIVDYTPPRPLTLQTL